MFLQLFVRYLQFFEYVNVTLHCNVGNACCSLRITASQGQRANATLFSFIDWRREGQGVGGVVPKDSCYEVNVPDDLFSLAK